jgi:hypothetical protein
MDALALHAHIRPDWKGWPGTNIQDYLGYNSKYKKVYNKESLYQCYETVTNSVKIS